MRTSADGNARHGQRHARLRPTTSPTSWAVVELAIDAARTARTHGREGGERTVLLLGIQLRANGVDESRQAEPLRAAFRARYVPLTWAHAQPVDVAA